MEPQTTILYRKRFNKELDSRIKIWKVLCEDFFQKYIKPSNSVCDLGAGYCEFINNIKARERFAVDINPETKKYSVEGVKAIICSSVALNNHLKKKMDVVFVSNFFEHLPTKEDLIRTLIEIKKVLKRKGLLIILMPNIRFVGSSYWDFLDHQLPLSDRSMVEALELNGFEIEEKKIRFLPYTTKSKLPKAPIFVKLYLKLVALHFLIGKQSLIIARII